MKDKIINLFKITKENISFLFLLIINIIILEFYIYKYYTITRLCFNEFKLVSLSIGDVDF